MSEKNIRIPVYLQTRLTLMFMVLAALIFGLLAFYWVMELEPQLKDQAEADVKAMTYSQAKSLADALTLEGRNASSEKITEIMDEILLLTPSNSQEPFIRGVRLEVDYEVVKTLSKEVQLVYGEIECKECFLTEIPLYSGVTRELLGIARFYCSGAFLLHLRQEVQIKLFVGSVIVFVFLILSWWITALLVRPLGDLATVLQGYDVEKLPAIPGLSGFISEEIRMVKMALDSLLKKIMERTDELRRAKEYQQAIVNTIPSGLAALDEDGRILSGNPGLKLLFPSKGVTGKRLHDLVPSARVKDAVEKVLMKGGKIRNLEISQPVVNMENALTLNTSIVGLATTEDTAIRSTGDRKQAKVLVVFDDITVLKRIQKELEYNIQELKRTQAKLVQTAKMSAVGELAAGVAHEMNNPLSAVIIYPELMKKKIDQFPEEIGTHFAEFPEQLDLIITAANRCKSIADNLLTFSRQTESTMAKVDLADLFDKTLGLLRTSLRHRGVRVNCRLPEKISVYGNTNQLQQALTNIILNSAQAMDKGGEISIHAKPDTTFCDIAISDTGPGISPENLQRIFDPFFTTKSVGKGTGLGLSIVYGIIEHHNGRIKVNSELGKGTTFTITLPVDAENRFETGKRRDGEIGIKDRKTLQKDERRTRLRPMAMARQASNVQHRTKDPEPLNI